MPKRDMMLRRVFTTDIDVPKGTILDPFNSRYVVPVFTAIQSEAREKGYTDKHLIAFAANKIFGLEVDT